MDKIYIISGTIGAILIVFLVIFLLSLPNGKVYSNGILILLPAKHITNIDTNGSYIINVKNNPTIYFFNKYYSIISSININNSFMVLTPLNQSYYKIILNKSTIITPVSDHNVSFEIFNSDGEFLEYNNSTSYTFIINETLQSPESAYSTKNSSILILNSSIFQAYPITINYFPSNAQYYQNISISCISNTKYMVMKTNYGINKIFNSGHGIIKTIALPNLNVSCYNGYTYITRSLNFSIIKPILNISYENGVASCVSMPSTSIYLYLNNKLIGLSIGSVTRNVSTKPPFSLRCETPGSLWQMAVNKTLNVS